jgi:hypothetical protein
MVNISPLMMIKINIISSEKGLYVILVVSFLCNDYVRWINVNWLQEVLIMV